jgi:glycerophosphoryl diester phosphodiesterase
MVQEGVATVTSVVLYGHRGAKGEAPENTLAGFAYGRRLGLTAFELDVHLSADERLVVIHDATVDRTTNGAGPVASFTAAELAAFDARAAFPAWPEPCGVPTLEDVLKRFGDTPHLQLELKTDEPTRLERKTGLLVALLDRLGRRDPARLTISSFDPFALEVVRRLAPDLPRAFIGAFDGPADLETAVRLGASVACIPLKSGSAATVAAAHEQGLRVTGWLGNSAEDVAMLLGWGVDEVTTDYPTVARAALHGQATI